jgi:hypothetical protein
MKIKIVKLIRKIFDIIRIANHFFKGIILPFDDSKSASDEDNALVIFYYYIRLFDLFQINLSAFQLKREFL